MQYTAPIKLTSARAWRTYTGGSMIDAIHGIKGSVDTQFPEEWIMSTVVARNAGRDEFIHEGLSFLVEQRISLRDLIESNPVDFLGATHSAKVGSTTGVLVKLIDAAERLTVQVHPTKQQALRLFNSQFGKTEAWHILAGRTINREPPCIYMGFQQGITRQEWVRCFHEQDIPALLGHMHRFEVQPGETYLIKGGVPHAIGQGCLLIEIQESTDYTIRVERTTPSGLKIADRACHQGLGFEQMFDCFEYDGISREEAYARWRLPLRILAHSDSFVHRQLVGYDATPCFSLERFDIANSYQMHTDGTFHGLYILSGEGTLGNDGHRTPVKGGDQFFVPASCTPYTFSAHRHHPIVVFRCFGPQL